MGDSGNETLISCSFGMLDGGSEGRLAAAWSSSGLSGGSGCVAVGVSRGASLGVCGESLGESCG
eukprot:2144840-Rhodomonas_salina.1